MTQSVPPDPQRNERQDEFIAVVVALAAIGVILFWGVTRGGNRFRMADLGWLPASPDASQPPGRSPRLGEVPDIGVGDREDLDEEGRLDLPFGELSDREDMAAPPRRDLEGRLDRDRGRDRDVDRLSRFDPTDESMGNELTGDESTDSSAPAAPIVTPPPPVTAPGDAEADAPGAGEEQLESPLAFSDVETDYWAKPFIDNLSQRGIVSGFPEGDFRPDETVTRAQFAANLSQAFGNGTDAASVSYIDVTADYWAADAIQQVTQTGFMTGYPEQDFRPNEPVSRLEVLIALVSGLDLTPPAEPESMVQRYRDRPQIPDWAIAQIAAATEAGLVVNHPDIDTLNPSEPATRAETAAMIYQALVHTGSAPDIASDYVVSSNEGL